MGDWDSIFSKKGRVFEEPQEDMEMVAGFLVREGVRKVLDLGAGTGRHTVFLAGKGFKVHAMDISRKGLEMTGEWLREKGLKAEFIKASCYERFPFGDDSFDAVISIQVIHHNYHDKIEFCISEIERVLRPGGVLFVTVPAKKNKRGATASKRVAPRTYIPVDGDESGLPHYLYNRELMRRDFSNFKILNIHVDKGNHFCLLGKLKS